MRRRTTLKGLMLAPVLPATLAALPAAAAATPLPAPRREGGAPMLTALARRQSVRAYADRALPPEMLSTLLWAAFGVNRPQSGDRTAPSWRGSKEIDIYVATAEAVWLYEPVPHALRRVMDGDIREATGRQPFPATAPVVLIYVADRARMAQAPAADQHLYAHVDAALVAQNVYLFAAAEGLGTVVIGNVEKPELAAALKLRPEQILCFTQPVGYPR